MTRGRTRRESDPPISGTAIQAAEHEAAKQRLLDLAEAERTRVDVPTPTEAVPVGRRGGRKGR
ncbi:hypothetical protein [Micromonospora rosaria]|nr:hypothetical protein [Micromonospora rosaria]